MNYKVPFVRIWLSLSNESFFCLCRSSSLPFFTYRYVFCGFWGYTVLQTNCKTQSVFANVFLLPKWASAWCSFVAFFGHVLDFSRFLDSCCQGLEDKVVVLFCFSFCHSKTQGMKTPCCIWYSNNQNWKALPYQLVCSISLNEVCFRSNLSQSFCGDSKAKKHSHQLFAMSADQQSK